jgi:type IV secretory pathway VirJ component
MKSSCALVFASALAVALVLASAPPAQATAEQRIDVPIRGHALTVSVYRSALAQPRGTIFMGSGDVGWVGLAVDMSQYLSDKGYTVVGVNVRQYLGAFTSGKTTLTTSEPPGDYNSLFHFLTARKLIAPPVYVSGVSEGAALAVLAGASAQNRSWVRGVMTMGLPPTAELGWRWSDFTSWITKKDSDEPMFKPKEFVPAIAPLPLCMIQSTRDEYVTEADYRQFEKVARDPKKLVLIDAGNHRFTDRRKELQVEILGCLAWMREHQPPP